MKTKYLLIAAAIAALGLALSGCGSKCDPTNCGGCCDASGACQPGTAKDNCGKAGAACASCAGVESCLLGACGFPGGGNNGGNSGNTTSNSSSGTSSSSGTTTSGAGSTGQTTTSSSSSTSTTGTTGGTGTTSSSTTTTSTTSGTTGTTTATTTTGGTTTTTTGSSTTTTGSSTTGSSGSTGGLGAICASCTDATQCASNYCNTTFSTTGFCDYATSCSECGSVPCDSVNQYCVCPQVPDGGAPTSGDGGFCSAGPTKRTLNNSGIGTPCTGSPTDGGAAVQGTCAAGQTCEKLSPWDTLTRCTQFCDGSFTMCPGDTQCAYTDPTQVNTRCFPAGYDDGTGCPSGLVPVFPASPDPSDLTFCAPACRTAADCNGSNAWNYACVGGTCKCTNSATDCASGAVCDTASGACIFACVDDTTCTGLNAGCCLQYGGQKFCDSSATP